VGSSVNPSLKRCHFRWQCPVTCPTTHLNLFLFNFNRSSVLLAEGLSISPFTCSSPVTDSQCFFVMVSVRPVLDRFLGTAFETPQEYTSAWSTLVYCPRLKLSFRLKGRAIAQAAARVRAQVRSCGICGGQSGTGAGFLRVLRFSLPIRIPPTAPHSSSFITRGWYNRPISGRRTKWTESHPTPRN
jgi:hypothetical protein